ncbi:MAG: hypothetical protein EB150_07695 [Nitrososphaeria archaeon]|nr:hypothetical protein [Nitrososphaeria archaeon]
MKFAILVIFGLVFTAIPLIQPSFGHGVGGETLPPVQISGKNATLSLFINPPTYDPKTGEYEILLKLYETNTQAVIPHVTYLVQMSHDGKQLFSERFHDDSSNLSIKVVPKNTNSIKIDGSNYGELGWSSNIISPLKIEGPIFLSGGLYKFHIEVLTIGTDSNKLNPPTKFDASISLADLTDHKISYEGNDYAIGVMSYYDKINNFSFDDNSRTVSFSMPYDWSKQNISQTSVVHQEIRIPKNFVEMLVTKYDATVNGIPIPESGVTIDDYTTDSRIVHLVLTQKELGTIVDSVQDKSKMTFTMTPSKQEKFPLSSYTHNAIFQVGLSWDPAPIQPGKNTRFYVDITRYFAPKVREDAKFDFVISQHGQELYRKSVTGLIGADEKTNYYDYTFSDKNLGPIIISIENINGEKLSSTDYVIVVKPQETKKTFPIRVQSTSNGSPGKYFVDLTWIPENLQPGQAEFILTIYDKDLQPVSGAKYDFAVLQNSKPVYQNSAIAKEGGSFEDVTFFEANKGPLTLQVSKIDRTNESVELPITVTPEFPLGWILVFTILFSGVIVLSKINKKTGYFMSHPF